MHQTTLAIIKPDAVKKQLIGQIIARAEAQELSVAAMKLIRLSKLEAEGFYHVHHERGFFGSLTDFMSEGPVVVLALRGEDAVARWREIMGPTDPAQAGDGTLRKDFGESIERNAVHGSDSPESAGFELSYFFSTLERFD